MEACFLVDQPHCLQGQCYLGNIHMGRSRYGETGKMNVLQMHLGSTSKIHARPAVRNRRTRRGSDKIGACHVLFAGSSQLVMPSTPWPGKHINPRFSLSGYTISAVQPTRRRGFSQSGYPCKFSFCLGWIGGLGWLPSYPRGANPQTTHPNQKVLRLKGRPPDIKNQVPRSSQEVR